MPRISKENAPGDAAGAAAAAVTTHEAAPDPHAGYQKESEKGAVSGYAGLGSDGKVPDAQLVQFALGFFGTGVDGALTFDGTTTLNVAGSQTLVPAANVYTLARDIFATTVVINNGVTVKNNGFRIYASVSFTNNGTLSNNGGNAAGAAGGAAGAAGSLAAGIAGGTGVTTNAAGATPGNPVNVALSGSAGSGGGSGTGNPAAGGSGVAGDGWNKKDRKSVV